MTTKIEVSLSDRDVEFVKWYAKRDGISYKEELTRMLYVAISDEEMIYGDEFYADTGRLV